MTLKETLSGTADHETTIVLLPTHVNDVDGILAAYEAGIATGDDHELTTVTVLGMKTNEVVGTVTMNDDGTVAITLYETDDGTDEN
jgi:ribosomal protein L3